MFWAPSRFAFEKKVWNFSSRDHHLDIKSNNTNISVWTRLQSVSSGADDPQLVSFLKENGSCHTSLLYYCHFKSHSYVILHHHLIRVNATENKYFFTHLQLFISQIGHSLNTQSSGRNHYDINTNLSWIMVYMRSSYIVSLDTHY